MKSEESKDHQPSLYRVMAWHEKSKREERKARVKF